MRTVAQYKIVDDESIGAGFQMGLRLFGSGAAKPAYDAYKLPIWVSGSGANVTVYGQVRPADNGTAQTVDIQNASSGAGFKTVQSVPVTSANGTFTATVPNSGGSLAAALERAHLAASAARGEVKRALVLLAVMVAALGAATAPAHAADLEIGMEDEGLLLANPHLAPFAVDAWHKLGVKVVRIHARWWVMAPGGAAQRKPAGFRATDPNDPRYDWSQLDGAVALVRSYGIKVMLTITGPGPLWASKSPRKRNPRYWPKAADYRDFARAVATRYSAQVDRYLLWNEPNQPGWLQPQSECKRRRQCTPLAPHIYRSLVNAAVPAIHAADPGSEIVVGELAPVGNPPISDNTPIAPLIFLREMACVDGRYKTIRGGRCTGFKAVPGGRRRLSPAPDQERARSAQPGPERGAVRRSVAAVHGARPAQAQQAAAREQRLSPDRVRLPDVASRPRDRRHARPADALPAAGGVHRLERRARAQPVLLPVGRRARGLPRARHEGLLGLAERAALRHRPAQARALDVRRPARDRPHAQARSGARYAPRRSRW